MKINKQLLNKAKKVALNNYDRSVSYLESELHVSYNLAVNIIDSIIHSESIEVADTLGCLSEVLDGGGHDIIRKEEGYIVGYSCSTLIGNMIEEIKVKLGDNLSVARGMEIVFYTNEDMPVSILSDLWNEMMALIDKDIESGFNLEIDNNLSINEIRYEVLLSGLDELEYINR